MVDKAKVRIGSFLCSSILIFALRLGCDTSAAPPTSPVEKVGSVLPFFLSRFSRLEPSGELLTHRLLGLALQGF